MQFPPSLILFGLSVLAFLSLAVYAIFFRRNVAALPFAAAMLLGAFWALARGLEITSVPLVAKILWHQLRFIPVSVMPALWLLIALHHAGRTAWLTPLRMAVFLVEPAATAVLALTGGATRYSIMPIASTRTPPLHR